MSVMAILRQASPIGSFPNVERIVYHLLRLTQMRGEQQC